MLKPSFTQDEVEDLDFELKNLPEINTELDDDEDGYANVNPIITMKNEKSKSRKKDLVFNQEFTSSNKPSVRPRTLSDLKRDFQLGDIIEFVHNGLDVINNH
jgi:hypothetical protein